MAYQCPNNCGAEEFVACKGSAADALAAGQPLVELSILLDKGGKATNRWEDGVVGVPKELAEELEAHAEDCAPYCPTCCEEAEWRA